MTEKPKRPSRWSLYIPFVLLVVVAAAWSVVWLQVKAFAQTEIETARGELEEEGVLIECAEENVGGYPFRLEWTCTEAQITFLVPDAPNTIVEVPEIKTVAQAYELGHVITEFKAPALIRSETGVEFLQFAWELGRASVRITGPNAIDRVALQFTNVKAEAREGTASMLAQVQNTPTIFEAGELGLSGSVQNLSEPFSADVSGYSLALTAPTLGGTLDARWSGVLSGLTRNLFKPDSRDAKQMARIWQSNGGQFVLDGFDVLVSDQVVLNADGDVALGETGLLQGGYNLRVSQEGISDLPSALGPMLAGILLFGQDEVRDEKNWRAVSIKADQGTVSVNGIPLLQTDSVF